MKNAAIILLGIFASSYALFCQSDYGALMEACKQLGYLESQECMTGQKIPEFDGITYDGKQIGNHTLKNKVSVINFWFMACPPCMAELGGLNAVVEFYKERDDVAFISFTTDEKQDIIESFLPFHQLEFEIIPDAKLTIIEVFKIWWGFPTTIVIDKSGKIHKVFTGGSTDEEEASKEIERTLRGLIDDCLEK